jgi:hypothetical protein
VACLFKARTVEPEKQLLLGNGQYTHSRGTRSVASIVLCGSVLHSFVMQLCGKHISAAVKQHNNRGRDIFCGSANGLYRVILLHLRCSVKSNAERV